MRLLIITLLLVGSAAAGAAPEPHAVAFMYHRFGDARFPSTNITLAAFEDQLRHLEHGGYQVWPLERIVAALRDGRPIPDRTVAITVDDAYRTVYENAFPLLQARNWPFTVFVSTDAVDHELPDYMTWEQMREMQRAGVRFANHSAGHAHLVLRQPGEDDAAWHTRVSEDLERAEHRLQEALGAAANPGRLLAYPFGEYDKALARLTAELGFTAFGQHSGAMGRDSDFRALPRYPVSEHYSDPADFALKAASLPLPVRNQAPWDPLVAADNPPRLTLQLAEGDADLTRLACYASGQGQQPINWLDRTARRFSVQARAPFPPGRARYNCTAPSTTGRWYWFSQPWIIPPVGAAPGD